MKVICRSLLVGLLLVLVPAAWAQNVPISGKPVPELSFLDGPIQLYLDIEEINAAVVGVSYYGEIVYMRGFGWSDRELTNPLQETATFRVASITKAFTAAMIMDLEYKGMLDLDEFAFDLGQPEGGILNLEPFPGPDPGDSHLADVTVRHLLFHEAGWDRDSDAGDLTGRGSELLVKGEMGLASLPTQEEFMRWTLGQPLQNAPGDSTDYSNVGYMALGLVAAQKSGTDLLSYVRTHLLTTGLWFPLEDLFQGRGLAEFQDPREPHYNYEFNWTNVYNPSQEVWAPYGGWDHELKEYFGRIVASAAPLLHLAHRYFLNDEDRGKPIQTTAHGRHMHGGALLGARSELWQGPDGYDIVVMTNRYGGTVTPDSAKDIRNLVINLIEDNQPDWPTETVDCRWFDFSYPWIDQEGTYDRPFDEVDDLGNIPAWSKVKFKPGSSPWTGVITRGHIALSAEAGGSVVIGQ